MTTVEEGIAAVKAAFPTAEVVEVRDVGIPWCKAFDNELRNVRREGRRVRLYQELMWAAWTMGRKIGWASFFYKSLYGEWPHWPWKELPPVATREATWRMIRKRDSRARWEWKKQKERERAEREAHLIDQN